MMQKNTPKDHIQAEILRESGATRNLRGYESILAGVVAVSWALFQFALAGFLVLDSTKVRAVHLAFSMVLLYLLEPCFRKSSRQPQALTATDRIPLLDYVLAIVGSLSALYIAIDYEGIAMRAGMPLVRDLVIGVIVVALLLEAARRKIGPALSIIAILFTAYAFLGPYMPEVLAFKGVSLRKYISNIVLSTEGIYGIPLGVSASIVYLFVILGALLDRAGAGKFFTDLSLSLLGRYKGGAAKGRLFRSR